MDFIKNIISSIKEKLKDIFSSGGFKNTSSIVFVVALFSLLISLIDTSYKNPEIDSYFTYLFSSYLLILFCIYLLISAKNIFNIEKNIFNYFIIIILFCLSIVFSIFVYVKIPDPKTGYNEIKGLDKTLNITGLDDKNQKKTIYTIVSNTNDKNGIPTYLNKNEDENTYEIQESDLENNSIFNKGGMCYDVLTGGESKIVFNNKSTVDDFKDLLTQSLCENYILSSKLNVSDLVRNDKISENTFLDFAFDNNNWGTPNGKMYYCIVVFVILIILIKYVFSKWDTEVFKNIFGSVFNDDLINFGDTLLKKSGKGLLLIATITAGALSYLCVSDINNKKLKYCQFFGNIIFPVAFLFFLICSLLFFRWGNFLNRKTIYLIILIITISLIISVPFGDLSKTFNDNVKTFNVSLMFLMFYIILSIFAIIALIFSDSDPAKYGSFVMLLLIIVMNIYYLIFLPIKYIVTLFLQKIIITVLDPSSGWQPLFMPLLEIIIANTGLKTILDLQNNVLPGKNFTSSNKNFFGYFWNKS